MTATSWIEPSVRDAKYGDNMAQYLVDLHDSEATFDFCGGMMFQLVLSPALREHLVQRSSLYSASQANNNNNNHDVDSTPTVMVAPASAYRMHQLESYQRSAKADNLAIFHGREIRQVPWAKGGMGLVLHLSLATNANASLSSSSSSSPEDQDPEGWTASELAGYDGWGHDSGRDWRTGERLEQEGLEQFRQKFGPQSFSLHHRFYFHWDSLHRLWLAAEDGCEGTPATPPKNPLQTLVQRWF